MNQLKAELSHLANSYVYNYQPSRRVLRQHSVLKKLQNNKDIVICKPDKGNGVVILDRHLYDKEIMKLVDDKTKFKKLDSDPTMKREGALQRFLRKLKKNGTLNEILLVFSVYCV